MYTTELGIMTPASGGTEPSFESLWHSCHIKGVTLIGSSLEGLGYLLYLPTTPLSAVNI